VGVAAESLIGRHLPAGRGDVGGARPHRRYRRAIHLRNPRILGARV